MPKIPFFQSQRGLPPEGPGTLVDANTFAIEGRAAAEGWRSVGQAGEKLAEVGEKLRQGRQLIALHKTDFKAEKDLIDFKEGLYTETGNPETWPERAGKRFQEIQEETLKGIGDPQIKAILGSRLNKTFATAYQEIKSKSRKQEIHNFMGTIETGLPEYADLYSRAETDEHKISIDSKVLGLLEGGRALGLDPAKIDHYKEHWKNLATFNTIHRAGEKDPIGTLQNLDAFKLRQDQRDKVIPWLESRISKLQQDNAVAVDRAFDAGSLTLPGLEGMRDAKQINLSTYRFYEGALRSGRNFNAVTDMDVYVPLLQKAMKGEMNEDYVFRGLSAGRLKKDDARYLMGVNEQRKQGETPDDMVFLKDPAMKAGYNAGLHEIQWRLRPLDQNRMEKMLREFGQAPPRPEAMYENQALVSYIGAIKEAAKKGELTYDWFLKKAVEISRPFEAEGARGFSRNAPAGGQRPGFFSKEFWGLGEEQGQGPGVRGQGAEKKPLAPSSSPLFNPTKGPSQRQQESW